MKISKIIERGDIADYLGKRNLLEKYKKAKIFLLTENFTVVDLKKRKPKQNEIWQFRIDRQFRAFCYFDGKILVVFHIDKH